MHVYCKIFVPFVSIHIANPCCFSYKDIKEEKSQAFGFSKIKNALPSFECYLEDELAEYVKAYALLDERAQNLISTKPLLSAIRKNPAILTNYQNGIAKWQHDASNLSVTGGGFIRKLPIRNCVLPLQQKLRSLVLKQLVSFHEIRKNNIGIFSSPPPPPPSVTSINRLISLGRP